MYGPPPWLVFLFLPFIAFGAGVGAIVARKRGGLRRASVIAGAVGGFVGQCFGLFLFLAFHRRDPQHSQGSDMLAAMFCGALVVSLWFSIYAHRKTKRRKPPIETPKPTSV
jgi:hypothetical protein